MFDPTRSPRSTWKRGATLLLVACLAVAILWFIWTRELHHTLKAEWLKASPAVGVVVPGKLGTAGRLPI